MKRHTGAQTCDKDRAEILCVFYFKTLSELVIMQASVLFILQHTV